MSDALLMHEPMNSSAVQRHRLVMVDDRQIQLKGFKDIVREMHNDTWSIVDYPSDKDLLRSLERDISDLPTLVSIDLGLLPDPNSATYGLQLLEQVHALYPGLKLVVHSLLPITEVAAQVVLAIPASYISTTDDAGIRAYAALLPWLAQGFRIYSPAVSSVMSRVAITHPDPFGDEEWRVLELISLNKSNAEIASELLCAEGTVADKVNRIASRLNSLGQINVVINSRSVPYRFREPLKRYFQENAHKYGRRTRLAK